jgi:hypothetical protein
MGEKEDRMSKVRHYFVTHTSVGVPRDPVMDQAGRRVHDLMSSPGPSWNKVKMRR